MNSKTHQDTQQTIDDFGRQWTRFDNIDNGYYATDILFSDILAPLVRSEDVKGKNVADIGSGTGRIVKMLAAAGATSITAIEPSVAFEVLKRRVSDLTQVRCLNIDATEIPPEGNFDWIFSIGVIHHIPDAPGVMKCCFNALRPGGRVAIWLYGREGNQLYLSIALPLRLFGKFCPDIVLTILAWLAVPPLRAYQAVCKWLPLPMRSYFIHHVSRLDAKQLMVTVFDQLNPCFAKYYTRDEAIGLLEQAGFEDIKIFHRHGYSWSVCGLKKQ